ncbi:60S ribosomal protein L6 [Paramyrothecium foliicola]|nr:60S ribosomal protein L6 [Paramyrothecium foliicola]
MVWSEMSFPSIAGLRKVGIRAFAMVTRIAPGWGKVLGHAATSSSSAVTLPSFLVPAWQTCARQRQFSTTSERQSKLGRIPISIPPGVELQIGDLKAKKDMTSYKPTICRTITVTGPRGALDLEVPEFVTVNEDLENKTVSLGVQDPNVAQQKEMWGALRLSNPASHIQMKASCTSWSYLNNYVMGVSEGHTAILRLVGVGYRATVEKRPGKEQFGGQDFLCLKLGFTHPVEEGIPRGVKVTTPSPTRILIEGNNREVIMSFAGRVRLWRPPEPYKGKGVFINDQTIKLKQKKIK